VKTVRFRDNNDLLDLWCINPWLTSHMIGAAHTQRLDAAEQERVHAMFAAARSEGSCCHAKSDGVIAMRGALERPSEVFRPIPRRSAREQVLGRRLADADIVPSDSMSSWLDEFARLFRNLPSMANRDWRRHERTSRHCH
jgi:hypothetical protein